MKNKIITLLTGCFFLISFSIKAQQGKDGASVVSSTVTPNIYTSLAANAVTGATSINVASAAGLSVGDLIYIIQMQGASVNAVRDGSDTGSSDQPNLGIPYGAVTAYNNCGNNEFAEINAIAGPILTLDCGLKNNYDISGKVQVIRVPRYTSLTINNGGSIICPQWNGTTGGVVVIEVEGATTINTGGNINASGLGFRGAAIHLDTTYGGNKLGCDRYKEGAQKGEGIAGDAFVYQTLYAAKYGHGAMANGGGGGCPMNMGGGGGSNAGNLAAWTGFGVPDVSMAAYITAWNLESANFATSHSSGGGRGGYSFSNSNQSPTTKAPGNAVWAGDDRRNFGGFGGSPLDYTTGRIFMGGAGGAGDENDNFGGTGGNGGGIVYLLNYGTVTGAGQITSNGANGSNTQTPAPSFNNCSGLDGAGGAGGGGTVLINSIGAITLTNATPITAEGGKGGNNAIVCNASVNHDAYGPGGGGGGGYVAASGAVVSNTSGGANGIVTGANPYSSMVATNFPANGATKGDTGVKAMLTTFYLTATNYTVCAGTSASLTVTANGTGIPNPISYNWYNASAGGAPIFSGNPYNTPVLSVGTYTYYAGTCPGTYRIPVVVTVLTAPTVSVSAAPTNICNGQNTILTGSGATTYTWSANAGSATTATVSVSPITNTTYTVVGANGTCTNPQTITVNVSATPTISAVASNTTICSGTAVTFTASGATSYTWSANAGSATTSTVSVSPTANTTYTVSGDNGGCPGTQTISVNVSTTPTVTTAASNTTICNGSAVTFTASGATTYTWSANAGGATTSTVSVSPTTNTTYTVLGANGNCTATQTVSVNVSVTPTVSAVQSNTIICSGSAVTFTASGATSYTWSANAGSATTSTVSVSPNTNTTYTVLGANGNCASTQTVSVNVTTTPTVSAVVSNTIICSGSAVTFTASGATTYTWSANAGSATTSTVSTSPTTNTTYTVTGDNNGCTSTQTVSVVVNIPPSKVDSVSNAAACNQTNGSYVINSVTGGTGPYQINFNNTGFSNIPSFAYTVPNLGQGIYSVVIKDNVGCTYTTSVIINNSGGITQVDSVTKNALCNPPNSGAIAITSVTGGTGPYQLQVNGGGFNPISSFPDSLKNLAAGSYTVVVKDNSGCLHTSLIVVGNNGGPTNATIASVSDTCGKNVGQINITNVVGGTPVYHYSLNSGAPQLSNTFTGLATGYYTITVTDNNGCSFVQYDSVKTVGPSSTPTVTPLGNTTFCQGGSVVLSSSNPTGNIWNTTATTQTITVNTSGTYSLSVTQNGCTANSNTIAVIVNPTPTLTINSPTICNGSSTTLTASGAFTYTWTPTTGISSVNSPVVTANPSVTTVYTISATDANGCTTTNTSTVVVSPAPTQAPGLNPDSVYYCLYFSAPTLTATTTGGATLNWYDSNHNPLASAPTPATGVLGTTTYYVTQSIGPCQSPMDSIKVIVVPRPSATFATNPTGTVFTGQAITFTPANAQSPLNVYSWNFGDPTSSSNTSILYSPTHTYLDLGTFCSSLYVISTQTGCKDSSQLCFDVINGIGVVVPNFFSPNGDNINDVFSLKTSGISSLTCDIFDRWGVKLYNWNSITGFWDGTSNGKTATDGTYFYVIVAVDVKNETHTYNGYLQLLR